ncbi:MAG: FAD-dependent oxidoreductase [Phycicoccus sp.]
MNQTPTQHDVDVLVVGAGPTGLTAAIDLARRGVHARLVEREPRPSPFSKANSLLTGAMLALDDLGVMPVQDERSVILQGMQFRRGTRVVGTMGDRSDTRPYRQVRNVPQSSTELSLTERLYECGGHIEHGVEVLDLEQSDDFVQVRLRHRDNERDEVIRAQYVIACDGARSHVRKAVGLLLDGTTDSDEFVVADVRAQWDLPEDYATIFLSPKSFLLATKFVDDDLWHLVGNLPTPVDGAPARESFSFEELELLVRERCEIPVVMRDPLWISTFHIHHRHVNRYRSGRVFLAGDAAHLHSPMSGNGLGNSLQDSYNLTWKLDAVIRGVAAPEILDTYEPERRPAAASVLRMGKVMHTVLTGINPAARTFRDLALPVALRLVASQMRVGDEQRPNAMEADYTGSALVREGDVHTDLERAGRLAWLRAPRPGRRMHDHVLLSVGGGDPGSDTPVMLMEMLRGPQWRLVMFAGAGADTDVARLIGVYDTARDLLGEDVEGILVHGSGNEPGASGRQGLVVVTDRSGEAHRMHGATRPSVYLVRPDCHIGYRTARPTSAGLVSYLRTSRVVRAERVAGTRSAVPA